VAVADFFATANEFHPGDPVSAVLNVSNVSATALTNLVAHTKVINTFGQVQVEGSSTQFGLAPGEARSIPLSLNATLPGGHYTVSTEVRAQQGSVLAASSTQVHVVATVITSVAAVPDQANPRMFTFQIVFANNTPAAIQAQGVVRVFDPQQRVVAELSTSSIQAPAQATTTFTIPWNSIVVPPGSYTVVGSVVMAASTAGPNSTQFVVPPAAHQIFLPVMNRMR
jgi:hypothetical protein